MSSSDEISISKDLVAASAVPLVLALLREGENYGYAIGKTVKDRSGNVIEWADGMLYPVLHRLERQGMIEAVWKRSESGRKRKYYRLCRKGEIELLRRRRQWDVVHETLSKSWGDLFSSGTAVLPLF